MMVTKVCAICQQEFEAQQVKELYCSGECYKEARRRQALTPEQRARKAKNKAAQRARDPEHQRKLVRASHAKKPDLYREKNRQWYADHPGYRAEESRKWRAAHPTQKLQDSAGYYRANKDKVAARIRAYNKAHPDVLQLKNSRRRALKLNAGGDWTRAQFRELCEACDWHCAYCHERFDRLTPDHITPLSRGGSNDITNLIPACGPCNYSKQDKTPLEWLAWFLPDNAA